MNLNHNWTKLLAGLHGLYSSWVGAVCLCYIPRHAGGFWISHRASWLWQKNLKSTFYLTVFLEKEPELFVVFLLVSKFLWVNPGFVFNLSFAPWQSRKCLVWEGSLNWKEGSWWVGLNWSKTLDDETAKSEVGAMILFQVSCWNNYV